MDLHGLLYLLVGVLAFVSSTSSSSSSTSSEAIPSTFIEGTKRLLTGDKPIVFRNLLKVRASKNKNSTSGIYHIVDDPPKSKPLLFEKALGLRRGRPFEFNVDKWRALSGSGMYGNLSAHATTDNTGRAIVEISGYELPSITFAPELSAGVNGYAPDVSGGIAYEDNNFLGLGQRLSILLSKKEAENNVGDLMNIKGKQSGKIFPHIEIKWSDFSAGQNPKVAIKYDESVVSEYSSNLRSVGSDGDSETKSLGEKINTRLNRLAIVFKESGFRNFPFQKWGAPPCKIEAELEPYHQVMRADKTLVLSGTELSSTVTTPKGTIKAFCDQGHLFEQQTREMYVQAGVDYSGAPKLLGSLIPPLQNYSWMPKKLDLMGTLKTKLMTSFGAGRLPLYHFVDLGDTQVLRGQISEPEINSRVPSYAAIKGDLYVITGKSLNPGCFIDTAFYRTRKTAAYKPHVAMGVSLRAMGFRLDVGYPVDVSSASVLKQALKLKHPPRVYLGMDQEL